MKPTSFNYT